MRYFLAALAALLLVPACAGAVTVGKTNTTSTYDNSQIGTGTPQNYRFVAGTSGTVNRLNLFVSSSTSAASGKVGLYSGTSSTAQTLLAACDLSSLVKGAWNSCVIPDVQVTAGSYYFLAILQPSGVSGTLVWREGAQSGLTSSVTSGNRTALPASWTNSSTWSGYTASVYADQYADTTPPDTVIDSAPADSTSTDASVSFHATEPASFQCSIDGGAASACTSPASFSGLAVGSHTFTVVATDAAGNVDPSPATASWQVLDNPPPPPPPSSGFPDASNTGVPSTVTLTAYTGPSTITTDGTVIDGKSMGCIVISAANVVIRNSRIVCTGYAVYVEDRGSTAPSLTIEDSEVSCNNTSATAIGEANVTARRIEIVGCENGMDINKNFDVQDSFIHNLYSSGSEAHEDGIQMGWGHYEGSTLVPGAENVSIVHNTIFGVTATGAFGTSAIISNRGSDHDYLVQNNLLAGGAVALYCEQGASGAANNVRFLDNAFSTQFGPNVGAFGISTDCSDEVQSGNYLYETGAPLTLE